MTHITLVSIARLRDHQKTDPDRVGEVVSRLLRSGQWTDPILIEKEHQVVLVGHHRLAAAMELKLSHLPVIGFDYTMVKPEARRTGLDVSRREIIRRALSRDLYPPKSTRHIFECEIGQSMIPLSALRASRSAATHVDWVWSSSEVHPHVQVLGARYAAAAMLHPAHHSASME